MAAGYLDVAMLTSLGGGHLNHLTGAIVGPFLAILVPFWGHFYPFWGHFQPFWRHFEATFSHSVVILGQMKVILGQLGTLAWPGLPVLEMATSSTLQEPFWGHF